jgi:hypothetical protein
MMVLQNLKIAVKVGGLAAVALENKILVLLFLDLEPLVKVLLVAMLLLTTTETQVVAVVEQAL